WQVPKEGLDGRLTLELAGSGGRDLGKHPGGRGTTEAKQGKQVGGMLYGGWPRARGCSFSSPADFSLATNFPWHDRPSSAKRAPWQEVCSHLVNEEEGPPVI
ncbi:MAG: hypothetical protein ACUVX8_14405, partial [Candidatus Zipacnadales bacterium]